MLDDYSIKTPSRKWLVVSTLPHRETYACENLLRQDFNIYCPMLTKRIKHARNVYDAPRPLFPGYIFVEYKPKLETWRPILGTYGVKSVVRIGEQPSLLCGSFIDGLKARETDGVIRKQTSPLEVGQDVAIQGGPFDGLVGKVIELRDKDRVLLLLHLLDQQTKTHVRSDMLNPI
jgi:transcriptional antiterminator RfaH